MKPTKTVFALSCAVAGVLAALPAMAEEAAAAGHVEEGGLPQLNMALFPEQLFWLAVCFGFLYLTMHFIGLPIVKNTQTKRSETIGGDLAAAQAANEAAKNMMAEYEKALADARAKAQAIVSAIAAEAAKASAAKQVEQQKELAKRLGEAEAKIAAARDKAVKEVKGSAMDLASAIVEKVTAKSGVPNVA